MVMVNYPLWIYCQVWFVNIFIQDFTSTSTGILSVVFSFFPVISCLALVSILLNRICFLKEIIKHCYHLFRNQINFIIKGEVFLSRKIFTVLCGINLVSQRSLETRANGNQIDKGRGFILGVGSLGCRAKKSRICHLLAIAPGKPKAGEPQGVKAPKVWGPDPGALMSQGRQRWVCQLQ